MIVQSRVGAFRQRPSALGRRREIHPAVSEITS